MQISFTHSVFVCVYLLHPLLPTLCTIQYTPNKKAPLLSKNMMHGMTMCVYHEDDGCEHPEVSEESGGEDDLNGPALERGKVEEGLAGAVVDNLVLLLVFDLDLSLLRLQMQYCPPLQQKGNQCVILLIECKRAGAIK